jgi:hypothetical protein
VRYVNVNGRKESKPSTIIKYNLLYWRRGREWKLGAELALALSSSIFTNFGIFSSHFFTEKWLTHHALNTRK